MTLFQHLALQGLGLILLRLIMLARVTPGGESQHNSEYEWLTTVMKLGDLSSFKQES